MPEPEISWVGDYHSELGIFPTKIEFTNEGTRAKPIILAPMPGKLAPQVVEPKKVTVSLKSIRNPKFTTSYEVLDTDSIFAVKERLITDPESPIKDTPHTAGTVRLLLKAKAISDSRQLKELSSLDFTVMFVGTATDARKVSPHAYWGQSVDAAIPVPKQVPQHDDEPEIEDIPHESHSPEEIAFWKEMSGVLEKYGKLDLLARFKRIAN